MLGTVGSAVLACLLFSIEDAAAQLVCDGAVASQSECETGQLCPNLKPYPAFDRSIANSSDGRKLRFSTLSWNNGSGPLELVPGKGVVLDEGDNGVQKVCQRIYLDSGAYTDVKAGDFTWHSDHSHFHFDDYADYRLEDADKTSRGTGLKTTFCVMDTNRIDTKLDGASKKAYYKRCGTDVQGMSIGWGDQYSSHLSGQDIDISSLDTGEYKLIIEIDPQDNIVETNNSDNQSCILIHYDELNAGAVSVVGDGNCEPPATQGLVLDVRPRKYKGKLRVNLSWNVTSQLEINREPPGEDFPLMSTSGSNTYTDDTGASNRESGMFIYQVCETENPYDCSNEVTVSY